MAPHYLYYYNLRRVCSARDLPSQLAGRRKVAFDEGEGSHDRHDPPYKGRDLKLIVQVDPGAGVFH